MNRIASFVKGSMQEKEDKYEKKEIDDNDDGYDDGHNLKMKMNMTT